MVKIKTLTHQISKHPLRNPSNNIPFSKARQYQRAINAVKYQKIFAQPFITNLSGHSDGITTLAKCPHQIQKIISGSHNGQIFIWNVAQNYPITSFYAHQTQIKGLTFNPLQNYFLSSSNDNTVLLFSWNNLEMSNIHEPVKRYVSKSIILSVDHNWNNNYFATSGTFIQIWNYQRNKPLQKFTWGSDSIIKIKYNPSEENLIGATGKDNSILIYDTRDENYVQRIQLPNISQCLSWNYRQPINFTIGNNDSNLYTFDIRNMSKCRTIHKDHIQAVTDIDYSPTGKQFVSGSLDKTIRIFQQEQGKSKEVYHGKRMQQVNAVLYSMDGYFIYSGSQDMNIRVWKSEASIPLRQMNDREQRAILYRQKLIQKFKDNRIVNRIKRYRHLPKYILNAKKIAHEHNKANFRKRKNIEANNLIIEDISVKQKIVQKTYIQQ